MGTTLEIAIECAEASPLQSEREAVERAFASAARIERAFSRRLARSSLSRFNREGRRTAAVNAALSFATKLRELSDGAFHPFAPFAEDAPVDEQKKFNLDFDGFAKGAAVDAAARALARAGVPRFSVNAGGDLRFGEQDAPEAVLRLGSLSSPVYRRVIVPPGSSLATSSRAAELDCELSTTRYARAPDVGLGPYGTAACVAKTCAVADALTKVGLFARPEIAERCARAYLAKIFAFDGDGNLVRQHGDG